MKEGKRFFKNSWQRLLRETKNLHTKTISSLGLKKMTKTETDTKRNKDMSKKANESCTPPGLHLIAMRNARKGVEVQLEIKSGKKTAKKIVNHVQTLRKMRDLVITHTVIDQEDIAALMIAIKLS